MIVITNGKYILNNSRILSNKMYQFFFGFFLGAYIGTRYNLSPYVDSTEFAIRRFLQEAEKKTNTMKQEHNTDRLTEEND